MDVREIISNEIECLFGSNIEVRSEGISTYLVHFKNIIAYLYIDQRDQHVRSDILFLEDRDEEKIDLRIVSKLFPNIDWEDRRHGSIEEDIRQEIYNIKKTLDEIREKELSARDLRYFYLGYSTAYTDNYSR